MKTRILSVLLVLTLVFSCFGGFTGVKADTGLTEDNMTKVLTSVKKTFEIGEEYSEFNYYYDEWSDQPIWFFDWYNDDYTKQLSVQCDNEARIKYMTLYDSEKQKGAPKYLPEELADKAESYVKKIAPYSTGHVKADDVDPLYGGTGYSFRFVRVENGIEMPDNYVYVTLSFITGELESFNSSWLFDAKVPAASKLIGEEEAIKKLGANNKMELQYFVGWTDEGEEKIFLAYVPSESYLAVDAVTGEVYDKVLYWSDELNDMAKGSSEETSDMAAADAGGYMVSFSEAELAKIAELNDLISADEAVAVIRNNKNLLVDERLTSVRTTLNTFDGYTWSVYMNDDRPYDYESDDNYRPYLSATVDAKTGDLISFYASVESYAEYSEERFGDFKLKYNKTKCRKILESFLKEVDPEHFEQTKLSSSNDGYCAWYDWNRDFYQNGGFSFTYTRTYKDVPFYYNYIYGSVDGVSGKIYNYGSYWSDVELPEPDGVIGADAAFTAYVESEGGCELEYEVCTEYTMNDSYYYSENGYIRLSYVSDVYPQYIDAFTGKQLTWNGAEYDAASLAYEYSDIAGTKYERAIRLIAAMGAGFEDTKYEPNKIITYDEFASLESSLSGYISYQYLNCSGSKKLTRQAAAKAMISVLGYDDIAKLDIYKTGYKDDSKIGKNYKGYVALAKGLGIMDAASGKKFKPNTGVTRGEAAQILLNAIEAGQKYTHY